MKLYYSPGTCSLVPHIVLRETSTPHALVRVDLGAHQTEGGDALQTVNPKNKVPVLELPDGSRLTEGPVIAQLVAELAGATGLLPPVGDPARYRVLEWQAFISTELHKSFSPLFNPDLDPAVRPLFLRELASKFDWIESQLDDREFLTGDAFTLADAYLFTVAGWSRMVGPDLSALPRLQAFLRLVAARPAVRDAMRAEGLLA